MAMQKFFFDMKDGVPMRDNEVGREIHREFVHRD
jgi:hypothetical protein